jgi:lipid II isoglutaminyl synthase (glutamine-hydrolysing)
MTRRQSPKVLTARAAAGLLAGRTSMLASRVFRRGGTSLPGLVAATVDPDIVLRITRQLGHGSLVVTGTNGKTTTARMLAGIAQAAGLRVLHNRSGSNLVRGLASTAVSACDLRGRLAHSDETVGVFEVDEATLPLALPQLRPRVVVFTNLLRDQLDRYGEVDSITALWRRSLTSLAADAAAVLNADDPSVAELGRNWPGRAVYFGIDDPRQAAPAEHAADSRWCSICGSEYEYSALYFGHAGAWRCPGCRTERPDLQVRGTQIELSPEESRVSLRLPEESFSLTVPVGGLYNVYNALAACAGAVAIGLDSSAIRGGIEHFDAAFGRQETFEIDGRRIQVLLCKNPTGVNQVLRYISGSARNLLILLNDGIADGRDISWIWDVDYEMLADSAIRIVVSGRRATDMALRLKYAGLDDRLCVEPDEERAVEQALAAVEPGGCLYVLPTYTAMLSVRDRLARRASRPLFWQD